MPTVQLEIPATQSRGGYGYTGGLSWTIVANVDLQMGRNTTTSQIKRGFLSFDKTAVSPPSGGTLIDVLLSHKVNGFPTSVPGSPLDWQTDVRTGPDIFGAALDNTDWNKGTLAAVHDWDSVPIDEEISLGSQGIADFNAATSYLDMVLRDASLYSGGSWSHVAYNGGGRTCKLILVYDVPARAQSGKGRVAFTP